MALRTGLPTIQTLALDQDASAAGRKMMANQDGCATMKRLVWNARCRMGVLGSGVEFLEERIVRKFLSRPSG
jgi:hypothetical protein